MGKRHYATEDPTVALCGWLAVSTTPHEREVTCKLCLKRIEKRRKEGRHDIGWEEALRGLAYLLAGPPIVTPPTIDRHAWANMSCRRAVADGRHSTADARSEWPRNRCCAQREMVGCSCVQCDHDDMNRRELERWEADQQARPHRDHACPFGSTRAALSHLLRWLQDGPAARSSLGSVQSRAQETARLGTHVQVTQRHDRDSREVRDADKAHDIQTACFYAFQEAQACKGLAPDVCVTILLDCAANTEEDDRIAKWAEASGLSEGAVKGIVAHGMKVVTALLYVRGYVPMPRIRAGLGALIEQLEAAS